MGRNYEIWYETYIAYDDETGHVCSFVEKTAIGNYAPYDSEIDPQRTDSYRYPDSAPYDPNINPRISDDLKRVIVWYGLHILFHLGDWRCSAAGKERIIAICNKYEIPVEKLLHVRKDMNGRWR